MKIFYHTCLIFVTLTSFNSFSQLEIGASPENKKSDTLIKLKNDIEGKRELEGSTEIFIGSNCSSSFRYLTENGAIFGKPLGTRSDEKSLTTWSYSLGFRNYLHKHVALEGGVSYIKNGESYQLKNKDTAMNYQTTYSYIAMPIRLYYSMGDQIRFLIGGGIIPQMFNGYRQDQQWTNHKGETGTTTIKTKNNYNSFVLSACLDASLQIRYSKSFSIFITPEYRWQLNSTYLNIDNYIHKARAFGVNFGFVYQL